MYALKALAASLLAGLDSIAGVIVGGLALGVAEQLGDYLLGSWLPGFGGTIAYILMLIVLLAKPYGIFGRERVERV
jgi:branched-chain amino acid transport system permease protein